MCRVVRPCLSSVSYKFFTFVPRVVTCGQRAQRAHSSFSFSPHYFLCYLVVVYQYVQQLDARSAFCLCSNSSDDVDVFPCFRILYLPPSIQLDARPSSSNNGREQCWNNSNSIAQACINRARDSRLPVAFHWWFWYLCCYIVISVFLPSPYSLHQFVAGVLRSLTWLNSDQLPDSYLKLNLYIYHSLPTLFNLHSRPSFCLYQLHYVW